MGGDLVQLGSAADVTLLRATVVAAAGKPVWVAPVELASAVAAALQYKTAPGPGEMAALVLESGSVVLKNVACGTEGVVVMQADVAGTASAPASIACAKQEAVDPAGCESCETCDYTVLSASQPVSASAAEAAAAALGKRLVSFATEAEYDAVRASLAGSNAAALLASGALAGLWVDVVGSVYTPPGYTLPASGEAALLAGASLTLTNVPAASTLAGALLKKCSEVDSTIGE